MAKTHNLKCWPDVFQLMLDGKKTFEYRKNDRDYQEGDTLHEREWDPQDEEYSGRFFDVDVLLVIDGGQFGIPVDYCIMQTSRPLTDLAAHDAAVRAEERAKCDKQLFDIAETLNPEDPKFETVYEDFRRYLSEEDDLCKAAGDKIISLEAERDTLLAERTSVRAKAIDDAVALLRKIPSGAYSMIEVVRMVARLKEV